MEALIALVILLMFLAACLVLAFRHPLGVLVGLVVVVLAASCSPSEAARRFEVSVVAESNADNVAIDEAVGYAAAIFRNQLDTDLVVTRRSISTVADHTKAEALLNEVINYRLANVAERATDATVLFTRRELTRGYQGIATVGPACSEGAAAVVSIRSDGFDGQITAHELLHTFGVPHDHAAGFLMSESKTRAGSDYMSPDSLATFNAAPLDCLSVAVTSVAQSSAGGVPTGTSQQGGGGSMSHEWLVVFGLLAVFVIYVRRRALEDVHTSKELNDLHHKCKDLTERAPSEAVLLGFRACLRRDPRTVVVEFTTAKAALDFEEWLDKQTLQATLSAKYRARGGQ